MTQNRNQSEQSSKAAGADLVGWRIQKSRKIDHEQAVHRQLMERQHQTPLN